MQSFASSPDGSRVLTPLSPTLGSAVVFSSGWENMHQVEPLVSGTRFALPAFFVTTAEPPEVEAPVDAAAMADELLRSLVDPRSAEDFKRFMRKWHCLLAPGYE